MAKIIGRKSEQELLKSMLQTDKAELIAVYGRRRIGKTFLIRNFLEKQIVFELSGIHGASLEQQLENFTIEISKKLAVDVQKPVNWLRAFEILENYLETVVKGQKKVIFFDEFPWIHTPKSGFLEAFENFWNMWASRNKNIMVVLCGSAAAWMIQKVINNKGGLHNRVTQKIRLLPFTLYETLSFFKERKVNLDRYQVLQLYMVMGGIPQYLDEVRVGESAVQAIDRSCFTKDGFLQSEFKNLFRSLFDESSGHIQVVRALSEKGKGLSRNEIIEACNLKSGAGITTILEELTESGFITDYIPFGKNKKDRVFKLTDEYSLFYLKFIEGKKISGTGSWAKFSAGITWKIWNGFSFENVCMKHTDELKKALGIQNVNTETSIWRYSKKGEQGAQIDLLIDRQDQCINVCEMKFSIAPYEITKAYKQELETKLQVFRQISKTKKTLFLTMITTYGVSNPGNYPGLVQSEIVVDSLF